MRGWEEGLAGSPSRPSSCRRALRFALAFGAAKFQRTPLDCILFMLLDQIQVHATSQRADFLFSFSFFPATSPENKADGVLKACQRLGRRRSPAPLRTDDEWLL